MTLLSFCLISTGSDAEQYYQAELSVEFHNVNSGSSTDKVAGLFAEVYFTPVNTENKPLGEAAFLDKSSSVQLGYINNKTDAQISGFNMNEISGPLIGVHYITETDAFILGAFSSRAEFDIDGGFAAGHIEVTGISIGKYLNDSSAVIFSYLNNKTVFILFNDTYSKDFYNYTLLYKRVQPLDATRYISLGTKLKLIQSDSFSVKEENQELAITGQYFFSPMTDLAVAVSFNSGDDISIEGTAITLGARLFFVPQIELSMSLSKLFTDNNLAENIDSVSVQAIARF